MRSLSLRSSALCLSLLLAASCREVRDLFTLGAALQHQYPGSRVSVSLTDGLILTVTVADSGLAVASCERQATMAAHIATFVRARYHGFDELQTISIAYASSRSAVRTTAAAGLPFRFAPALVGAGLTPADSARSVETCRTWRELQG